MATTPGRSSQLPILSSFDVQAKGQLFRERFASLEGEFVLQKQHASEFVRSSLEALGFKEKSDASLCQVAKVQSVDRMTVAWCRVRQAKLLLDQPGGNTAVNYLPHTLHVTNKRRLVQTVLSFERRNRKQKEELQQLRGRNFLPATVVIGAEKKARVQQFLKSQRLFFVKPASAERGEGIRMFRSDGSLKSFNSFVRRHYRCYNLRNVLLQKYIERPLLVDGKKFDLRVFLLVVSNRRRSGVLAFVHPGYVRCTCRNYDAGSDDLRLHIASAYVQRQDSEYEARKELRGWSPDELNEFLNRSGEQQQPCSDWTQLRLYPRIRAILAYLVSIVSKSLGSQSFAFELFGCDFVVDDEFNVWLLELNRSPALLPQPEKLMPLVKDMVEEAVAVATETLQLTNRQLSTKRLVTQQNFCRVFNQGNGSVMERTMRKAGLSLR